MRPLVDELIKNQFFYLEGQTIVHMETELRIASINNELILEDEKDGTDQNWTYDKDLMYITNAEKSVVWKIHMENDGKLILESKYEPRNKQQWILQELTSIININYVPEEYCMDDNVVRSTFFLKNSKHPCLVLTGANLGYPPEFKIFDEDNYKNQMWFFLNDHIVNLGSGLAIMMDKTEVDGGFAVIMWHYFTFSSLQMWVVNTDLRNKNRNDCFLNPKNDEKNLILNTRCINIDNSKWSFVEVDDDGTYIKNVTCMFFIQTSVTPCELLTGFGHNKHVRLRPIHDKSESLQLWFWDNNYIINAYSGLALTTSSANIGSSLYLTNKNQNPFFQQWTYSNMFITLYSNPTLTIGFSRNDGDVSLYSRYNDKNQAWKLIDQNEVVVNQNVRMCGTFNSSAVAYLIRSEHGDCPLLAHIGNNEIGTRMSDSVSPEAIAWVWQNDHIISLDNTKSLSIQDNGNLFLENTFYFEKRQRWNNSGDYMYTKYNDKLLTYVSDNHLSLEYFRGNSEQKWKVYTVNEVEGNDKLLRCSRCYNAGEETANEIMSYIPFLSSIYSAFRSVVYAIKKCPKVVWETLKSLAIDLVVDAAIALLTVVTSGAASAFAVGIKTGLKAGFKAGIKASFKAMKSMIKLSFKTIKLRLKNTVKRGFTKTLKAKLTTAKTFLKDKIKAIRSLPHRLKAISKGARQIIKTSVKATLKSSSALTKRLKYLWKKRLNVISRLGPQLKNALKNLPENIRVSIKKTLLNSKVKLNRHLNKLAEPAEKALNKLDDIYFPNKLMRCRRMIGNACSFTNEDQLETLKTIRKAFDYRGPTYLQNKLKDRFDELLKGINMKEPGQKAVVGVRQSGEFFYTKPSDINYMRTAKKRPIPKDKLDIVHNNDKTNVMHTEQDLLSTMKDSLKKCHKEDPCEVFLYTKLSPCTQHPQSYAESCLKYIVDTCNNWFTKKGTRYHVGFGKFYDNNKEVFTSQWDEYFKSFMGNRNFAGKKDKLLSDLKNMGFSEETIRNTDEVLKENVEKIRENLVDRMTKEGYEKLKKNINFDFSDAYNNAVKYLKDEKPNMADLVVKFEKELSTIDTTVKDLGKRFENVIDHLNSKYSPEILNVKNYREHLEKMATEAYQELKENVNVDFSDAFNNALKYLKGREPNTAGLVDKFKMELSKIHKTTVEELERFENLIDDWNAQYSRETLNKFATKRPVMSDITKVTNGIEKDVIDFSFYDLNCFFDYCRHILFSVFVLALIICMCYKHNLKEIFFDVCTYTDNNKVILSRMN